MRLICCIAVFAMITFSAAVEAQKGGTPIKPSQTWFGKSGDDNLVKLVPAEGFLTDQKAFEDLWKGWNVKGDAPKIDFAKDIVVVTLAKGGPNVPRASFSLQENGDVKVLAISTLIGGPGFGYSLDVLNRQGIKSIEGKMVPEMKK